MSKRLWVATITYRVGDQTHTDAGVGFSLDGRDLVGDLLLNTAQDHPGFVHISHGAMELRSPLILEAADLIRAEREGGA